ncbi:NAD-dependent epimerase/dehydratase family protein [Brevibacillus choshinensis]|uniref:NAD(P)H-binding protein n=1 Tax=Brevibacillus choshinensis TaxID=54911 RepID=A0ABX7FJY0_BRECH|nr:NAD(P)H-binding protein [Brevibacillus choshinensis]QRG65631.1 NAD(P)H-binding protein [Brevibacillus choshinensis]
MNRAIVVGATGGTGAAITAELVKRGIPVIAFGRSLQKLKDLAVELGSPAHLSLAVGDAFRSKDILAAADGVDVLFHCANVPYHEMADKLIPLGEAVMEAANQKHLKVVAIDGIYPYGRRQMDKVTENHPKQPHTKKGKVRLAFEQMLFSDRWTEVQTMVVRLPDYYGPTANQASYLGSTLEAIAQGKPAFFIGNMVVPREYVYLPDAAAMVVELACRDHAYGQNWNIPGAGTISGKEIVRIARKASGKTKPVIPLGRVGLSILGRFVPVMKEVIEMLYLTEEPLLLSAEKYKREIGPIKATPFEEGINATIHALQSQRERSS